MVFLLFIKPVDKPVKKIFFYSSLKKIIRSKFFLIGAGLCLLWFWLSLPSPLFSDPLCTVIESDDGRLAGAKIADDGQWRFPQNDHVPEKFVKCIVQFEDRHFFQHPGVNPVSLMRALKQNIKSKRIVSGGSTLTMQVIRLSRKGKARTVFEKAVEMILSVRLELSNRKTKILSFYASNAPFGGNVVGLDAASWRYFGRDANHLSWAETAVLAVLPNAPSLIYPGKNHERLKQKRNRLLNRLYEAGEIDSSTCELSKAEPLPGKPFPLPQSARHLLTKVFLEGQKGKRVRTTINGKLQQLSSDIIKKYNKFFSANEVHNAAAIVIEVETGNVLVYLGNTDKTDSTGHENDVDIITAPRSTGSIMKPFLFAGLIKEGSILPNTLIPDIPTDLAGFAPKNNNLDYDGAVPAYRALSRSLNVPSVKMLQLYGQEKFIFLLSKLGLHTINRSSEYYGLSIILGGAEATLWDLCGVYAGMSRTLNHFRKNSGKYHVSDWEKPKLFYRDSPEEKIKTGDKTLESNSEKGGLSDFSVLDAASVWFTYKAMVEVNRPENESEWEMFSSSKKIAWKTGTSFGNRDAWAIGTTPEHVVGVWVGNASGEGRPGLTGISAAAPVMFDIFSLLPQAGWFEPPYDEMSGIPVCSQSGYRSLGICHPVDTMWVNASGLKTPPCPYHHMIHLDKAGKFRVNSKCSEVSEMKHESWFILPPVQEWYYKSKSPNYRVLPPFAPGCEGGDSFHNMDLIYPKRNTKISISKNMEGKAGEIIFEAAHRKPGTIIYWHLDEKYIGSTSNFHQISLLPGAGTHTITLVDETGETLSRKFEVVNPGRK